jgi:hypothetical protein
MADHNSPHTISQSAPSKKKVNIEDGEEAGIEITRY